MPGKLIRGIRHLLTMGEDGRRVRLSDSTHAGLNHPRANRKKDASKMEAGTLKFPVHIDGFRPSQPRNPSRRRLAEGGSEAALHGFTYSYAPSI
jgi:hypothetical protein